jgi:hypothetical protein
VKAVSGGAGRVFFPALILLFCPLVLGAQNFWLDEEGDSPGPEISTGGLGLRIGGEITGELLIFPHELRGGRAGEADWGNLVSAKLNFDVSAPNAEAALHFKLSPRIVDMTASGDPFWTPPFIDELYIRAFLGPVTLETGLRKLAWGRADVQGPLDVTNPLDYTDLTNVEDTMGRKIARPMIHASLPLGAASKLEGVIIPNFQGHRYALDQEDRWYPTAIAVGRRDAMIGGLIGGIIGNLPAPFNQPPVSSGIAQELNTGIRSNMPNLGSSDIPETQYLKYAQGGLRFTTTLGPADLGFQYYSGFLFRPSFTINGVDALLETVSSSSAASLSAYPGGPSAALRDMLGSAGSSLKYNRYHQVGLDYTQVIFDFSFRAELAANITGDLKGNDGGVYNPSLAWSASFDRDLFGFTFFVEADESIRLLDSGVRSNPALDTEGGTPLTSTAITARISRSFFQDKLELKFSLLWNIEAGDVYLIPSVSYTMGDLEAALSGGIFAGKDGGELSQYRNNGYIKTALTYSF